MNELLLQIQQPPSAETNDLLLWLVGVLVVVVGALWLVYQNTLKQVKASHDLRVADRDKIISQMRSDIETLRKEKDEIMGQIKPTLEASITIAQNVLQLLKDEK